MTAAGRAVAAVGHAEWIELAPRAAGAAPGEIFTALAEDEPRAPAPGRACGS